MAESPAMVEDSRYLGVVAGGFTEPIGTDLFRVAVHPQAPLRHDPRLARWTLVSICTPTGQDTLRTLGIVEDVVIVPGYRFENAAQMAHSSYYRTEEGGVSTADEDAVLLSVRSLGHLTPQEDDLYGPVRPPERESRVYVANAKEVTVALFRPLPSEGHVRLGAYATFRGLYDPITSMELPADQLFLHGAVFASPGWGKTMFLKHLLGEVARLAKAPAVVVFNVKGGDFCQLDQPLPSTQLKRVAQWNPDAVKVMDFFQLTPAGLCRFDLCRLGKGGMSFEFSSIEPDEDGLAFLAGIFAQANLSEAAVSYATQLVELCKSHLTDRAHTLAGHARAKARVKRGPGSGNYVSYEDTLEGFKTLLEKAVQGANGWPTVECSGCNAVLRLQPNAANSILRGLGQLQQYGVFDTGSPLDVDALLRPGQVTVLDVSLLNQPAQTIFVQSVLRGIFRWANEWFAQPQEGREGGQLPADTHGLTRNERFAQAQEDRENDHYRGVVIVLDEAWQFFQREQVLGELETIARMGRSLKLGLWLADQVIPTGEKELAVLANFHTRIVGRLGAESRLLARILPLPESVLSVIPNLKRGMGVFFNREYSRVAAPFIFPPATCYHEGD